MFWWWDNLHEEGDLNLKEWKGFQQVRWWLNVPDRSGPRKKDGAKGNHTGFKVLELNHFDSCVA